MVIGPPTRQLQQQYKDHISDYKDWGQREHASEWLLYPENTGPHLSIDETSLSNGELYTIITNKAAKADAARAKRLIGSDGEGHTSRIYHRDFEENSQTNP